MKQNMNQVEENRDYKFDARLRYVENVMDAWIVFVQADSDRKVNGLKTPRQVAEFQKALYNLFSILKIHDPELQDVVFDEEFYKKLKYHKIIKDLTDNAIKKNDPGKAVYERFT